MGHGPSMVLLKTITMWRCGPTVKSRPMTLRDTQYQPSSPASLLPEGIIYTSDPACAKGKDLVVVASSVLWRTRDRRENCPYLQENAVVGSGWASSPAPVMRNV